MKYTEEYYKIYCGKGEYCRSNPQWGLFFGSIAETLIERLAPSTHFDAGCALGFLVEAFRDRGISSFGRDISEYAIRNARSDIQPYCEVGSITSALPDHYDLITCIEVLEHMNKRDALGAITVLTVATDTILFSSSPSDFDDPTHINVRPVRYWIEQFENAGFVLDQNFDASFVCSHAMLFRRSDGYRRDLRVDLAASVMDLRMERFDLRSELEVVRDVSHARLMTVQSLQMELDTIKSGLSWQLMIGLWRLRATIAPPNGFLDYIVKRIEKAFNTQ
jgi:SAM-dependent methyltransferase